MTINNIEHRANTILEIVRKLAQEKFKARAAKNDAEYRFGKENFQDLFEAGLMAPNISRDYGGLGFQRTPEDIFTLWMTIKEIAKADMGMARCWEGHLNSLLLLENIANPEQKARWFKGIVERGELWSTWSGEPLSRAPEEKKHFGTTVEETKEGYIINGTKIFCSSAPGASWGLILVNTAGPGAARHSYSTETLLMLGCDMSAPSVTLDDSWWHPIGMRSSASYKICFDNTFIPKENLIGVPGQFLLEEWQTRFTPQYTATFLGGAEAAYEYAHHYIATQNKGADPYIQHRIAKMAIHIQTAELWLRHVAELWGTNQVEKAKIAGSSARYLIEQLATETLQHCIHACGARALNKPSPVERILRDLSFYTRHDNDDHVLAMVGKSLLGQAHDISFFKDLSLKDKMNGKHQEEVAKTSS